MTDFDTEFNDTLQGAIAAYRSHQREDGVTVYWASAWQYELMLASLDAEGLPATSAQLDEHMTRIAGTPSHVRVWGP